MLCNTSYSLYLLNFPVLMMADLMWPTIDAALTGIPELAKRAIWIVVALIVLVSLSHATFRGIEGPLRRRTRELLGLSRGESSPQREYAAPTTLAFPPADPAPPAREAERQEGKE